MDRYYKGSDIIYSIGTAKFRELCREGMLTVPKLKAIDAALAEKGLSTKGWTPEDYMKAIEDLNAGSYYGIEFDVTVANPICTRIGDLELHKTLPVHSKMRGCLLADDGTVVKYLNSADWTSEIRDGSLGQVMVEVPEHWIKFESDGNKRRVYVAEREVPTFIRVPKYYVSAYEAAWDRTNNLLCSVVNTDPQFRGGNNQSAWDGTYRSMLGMPVTSRSRSQFLGAARKRDSSSYKWIDLSYEVYKDLFWLYYIEYANLNCQAAYTGERDANGYRQGGLGAGVTTINFTNWNNFNLANPFIPCGYTDSLGNGTGIVKYNLPTEWGADTVSSLDVPRWRGIENPFGHLWKICNGMIIDIQADDAGGESKFYVFDSPENYAQTVTEHAIFRGTIARVPGYIKEVNFGDYGDITPKEIGGTATTFFSDYTNTSIPATGSSLRTFVLGGAAYAGADAGFGCLYSYSSVAVPSAFYGSRLCYLTEY